jgi:hypothetical protein
MPIVMGPPLFVTLSNVKATPTATGFTLTFNSDQAFKAAAAYSPIDENISNSGSISDAAATTIHSIAINVGTGHGGRNYAYVITVDPTDVSGLTLRPYNGSIRLLGGRSGTAFGYNLSVPVRFYAFGGTPPAPSGGTGGQGGGTGNWNQYIWPQYNPKGTTYPTP